jgi:threonine-phosphate decarboxylase
MKQAQHGGNLGEASRRAGAGEEVFLDFSANLNVFLDPIGESAWAGWREAAHQYGGAEAVEIGDTLADLFGIERRHLLPTAGGVEGIYLAARLFADRRVLIVEPGFADYRRAFAAAGAEISTAILAPEDWRRGLEAVPESVVEDAEVILFGSPNNPTGSVFPVARWQRRWPGKIWLVDEAFGDYLESYPEIDGDRAIRFRSLTKSWRIPGLRLGYLVTENAEWLEAMRGFQPPWAIGAVTQAWARDCLHRAGLEKVERAIAAQLAEKERFANRIGRIGGLKVHVGAANFFLIETESGAGAAGALEKRGILVRTCDSFTGMPSGRFLRVAVRLPKENDRLVETLAEILLPGQERLSGGTSVA